MNFVNALEKIPGIIAQYEERTARLKADVPQFEAIISKPWGKEDELKQLKSELAPSTARLPLNLLQSKMKRMVLRTARPPRRQSMCPLNRRTLKRVWSRNRPQTMLSRADSVPCRKQEYRGTPEEGCKRDREHTVNPVCSLPYKFKNAPQVCCLATRLRSLLSLRV